MKRFALIGLILTFGFLTSCDLSDQNQPSIVYECGDGLCVIRLNGPYFKEITPRLNDEEKYPQMNDSGQIVFLCEVSNRSTPSSQESHEICIIDKDGKNFQKITNNDYDEQTPRINNLGQVVYACERTSSSNLCGFTFDEPEPRVIEIGRGRFSIGFQSFDINDKSQIVYVCSTGDTMNLCTMNFDGSDHGEIIVDGILEGERPVINNHGLIAYSCNRKRRAASVLDTSICSVNADGTNARILANNYDWPTRPSINDAGMIVYECVREDGRNEICIIEPGKAEPRYLTDNNRRDSSPSINSEGWVTFSSGATGISIIKHDGTEFEVRREGFGAFPSINK